MLNKKLKFIIPILLILAGTAVFFLLSQNNREKIIINSEREIVSGSAADAVGDVLKILPPEPFRKLVARSVIAPIFSHQNRALRFLEKSTGKTFEIPSETGRERLVSEIEIPGLEQVAWSGKGDQAIIKTNGLTFYYNYGNNQAVNLPKDIVKPIFSPQGDKIAWLCEEGICVSSPDGQNKKILLKEKLKELNLIWDDAIYFYSKPSALAKSPVFKISETTGNLSRVLPSLSGLIFKTANKNILYSSGDNLYLNEYPLALKTIASKCSFGEKAIYCAVPETIPPNIILPDDYFKDSFKTKDLIYQVSLEGPNYEKTLLQKTSLQIEEIIIGEDELYLRAKDGSVYILEF